jgi:hypothetical protein
MSYCVAVTSKLGPADPERATATMWKASGFGPPRPGSDMTPWTAQALSTQRKTCTSTVVDKGSSLAAVSSGSTAVASQSLPCQLTTPVSTWPGPANAAIVAAELRSAWDPAPDVAWATLRPPGPRHNPTRQAATPNVARALQCTQNPFVPSCLVNIGGSHFASCRSSCPGRLMRALGRRVPGSVASYDLGPMDKAPWPSGGPTRTSLHRSRPSSGQDRPGVALTTGPG